MSGCRSKHSFFLRAAKNRKRFSENESCHLKMGVSPRCVQNTARSTRAPCSRNTHATFFSFFYVPTWYSASCLMSFWWWTWNNVQITGGWNIRRIQMKTPLCLLRPSLFAPSFAAAPRKPNFDGAQIKDELIKWSTFIPNKLWQAPPPPKPQTSPPPTGSTNIARLSCRIIIFLRQMLF